MSSDAFEILGCRPGEENAAALFYDAVDASGEYYVALMRRRVEECAKQAARVPIAEQVKYAYERGRHDAFVEVAEDVAGAGARMAELREAGYGGY